MRSLMRALRRALFAVLFGLIVAQPAWAVTTLALLGAGGTPSAGGGGSYLTQDATGGTSGVGITSLTWTHVVNASANYLVVAIAQNGLVYGTVDCPNANSVTAGGVSMTRLTQGFSGSTTVPRQVSLWGLSSPPTGSISIVATIPNTCNGGSISVSALGESISYLNAASSPVGTPSESASTTSGVTSLSQTTTSSNTRGIVVAASSWRSTSSTTPGTGETTLVQTLVNTNLEVLITTQASSASTVDTHSNSTSDQAAMVAVPVNSN